MSTRNMPMQAQMGNGHIAPPCLTSALIGVNDQLQLPGVYYFILVFIYVFNLVTFLYSYLSATSFSPNYIFRYILVDFRYASTFVYLTFLFIYIFLCTSSLKYPILNVLIFRSVSLVC
jgi:hypothetical protein